MAKHASIRARVFRALDNAVENGYDPHESADGAIAVDLGTYDAWLEGRAERLLVPHIKAWKVSRAPRPGDPTAPEALTVAQVVALRQESLGLLKRCHDAELKAALLEHQLTRVYEGYRQHGQERLVIDELEDEGFGRIGELDRRAAAGSGEPRRPRTIAVRLDVATRGEVIVVGTILGAGPARMTALSFHGPAIDSLTTRIAWSTPLWSRYWRDLGGHDDSIDP